MLALAGAVAGLTIAPQFPPRSLIITGPPVAATVFSLVLSDFASRGLPLVISLLPALLLYCLIAGFFRRQDVILLFWIWTGLVLSIAIWLLSVAALHPDQPPTQWIQLARLTAFKVPNDIVLLPILMPVSLACFFLANKLRGKVFALSALGLGLLVTVIYQSRLATLAVMAGMGMTLGLCAWLRLRDPHLKSLSLPAKKLILAGAVATLALIMLADALTGFHWLSKWTHPWTTRLPLWLAALCMFSDSPVEGHGPGSFLLLYQTCLRSWQAAHLLTVDPRLTPWAHNLFLEILAEQGLLGFIAWMIPLELALKKGVESVVKTNRQGQGIVAAGIFTSLAIFCLIGFFELSLWRQWVAPLFFSLLAVCLKWVASPPAQ